jgi:hypothetical protein
LDWVGFLGFWGRGGSSGGSGLGSLDGGKQLRHQMVVRLVVVDAVNHFSQDFGGLAGTHGFEALNLGAPSERFEQFLDELGSSFLLAAFFFGFGGLLEFPLALFALEGHALGAVVFAAQTGQFAVDVAEALPAFFGVGFGFEELGGETGHFGGEDGGEVVAEFGAVGGLVQVLGVFGEVGGGVAGVFAAEPLEVAGLAPVGEVLGGDGAAGELFFEEAVDLGLAVEPVDKLAGGVGVFEAAAQLRAEGMGETADFAGVGGGEVHGAMLPHYSML